MHWFFFMDDILCYYYIDASDSHCRDLRGRHLRGYKFPCTDDCAQGLP